MSNARNNWWVSLFLNRWMWKNFMYREVKVRAVRSKLNSLVASPSSFPLFSHHLSFPPFSPLRAAIWFQVVATMAAPRFQKRKPAHTHTEKNAVRNYEWHETRAAFSFFIAASSKLLLEFFAPEEEKRIHHNSQRILEIYMRSLKLWYNVGWTTSRDLFRLLRLCGLYRYQLPAYRCDWHGWRHPHGPTTRSIRENLL